MRVRLLKFRETAGGGKEDRLAAREVGAGQAMDRNNFEAVSRSNRKCLATPAPSHIRSLILSALYRAYPVPKSDRTRQAPA